MDVICAASGKEAIEQTQRRQPDVLVLDVRLPDMSGLEVFDRIRQTDPRLPVVIITAHATTEIAIEAMKRGAFEYLLKPVDLHQLREVVAQALALELPQPRAGGVRSGGRGRDGRGPHRRPLRADAGGL